MAWAVPMRKFGLVPMVRTADGIPVRTRLGARGDVKAHTSASPRASNCRPAWTQSPASATLPAAWADIELSAPWPERELTIADPGARKVMTLVRLHNQPLGVVVLDVSQDRTWHAHSAIVMAALRSRINDHLAADGLPGTDDIESIASEHDSVPQCISQRIALMIDPPQMTVIVATHERPDALRACLDSVLRQDYPRFKVVVVDNDPHTIETTKLIATQFYPRVQYVRELRRGTAPAHNRGLHAAQGTIAAFVDDTVVVDRSWLTGVAEGFAGATDVGCVTGPTLPAELNTHAQLMLERRGAADEGFEQRTFDTDLNRRGEPLFAFAAGRFGAATNLAFDTALLRRLGGVEHASGNGTFTRGGRDLSAFFRIILQHRLVYQPAAIVWSST